MVIHGIVAVRAVRAIRVVNVIAILELEEALYVVVNGLTVLLFICLAVIVKEVIERLIVVVNALVGVIFDLRIALYQRVLHKWKAPKATGGTLARPFVNARAGTTIELELTAFIDAGVVIFVVVVNIGGIVVVAIHDPVVEQVDRGTGRVHRLHDMVAKGNRLLGRRTRRAKHERTRRQRDGQNL